MPKCSGQAQDEPAKNSSALTEAWLQQNGSTICWRGKIVKLLDGFPKYLMAGLNALHGGSFQMLCTLKRSRLR